MNKPVKNKGKLLAFAAGTKMKDPIAITTRPQAIPFLNPVRFRIKEDGIARKK
jgi:hypothetical protein